MVVILNLLALFAVTWLVGRKQTLVGQTLYWPAVAVRLLGGIAVGLLYSHYYLNGDTFYLFDLAREQAALLKTDVQAYFDFLFQDANTEWKGVARSIFFIKLVSIVSFFTNGNYWLTSLWFSLLAFFGSLYLFNVICRYFAGARLSAATALFFFPSVVFWGSGLIKESLALAAIMVLSGMFLKGMMHKRPMWIEFLLAALCIWIAWRLKYYWISVFIPVTVTSYLVRMNSLWWKHSFPVTLLVWILLFSALCFGAMQLHPNFSADRLLTVVVENNEAFTLISSSPIIHYDGLSATWSGILLNSPWALVSGLFRPFLWETGNIVQMGAAIENLLVLVLTLTSLGKLRQLSSDKLVAFTVIIYVALLCIFLALSTPNFGTLSRYKVGFLPFLIFLITYQNPFLQFIHSRGGKNPGQ